MAQKTHTPNVDTALAFLKTFETMDVDANMTLRSSNCQQKICPTTVASPHAQSNTQCADYFTNVRELIKNLPCTPTAIFDGGDVVTIHCTSVTTWQDGIVPADEEESWRYEGEYVFVFRFDENGKIEYILEMMDSIKAKQVFELMGKARARLTASK